MKRQVYVVAGAIIKDNKVFSAQRGDHGETKFKWEFPGGKIEPNEIPRIIEDGKRENAGKTLPPNGLYLVKVEY